jgi:hypothetical protein
MFDDDNSFWTTALVLALIGLYAGLTVGLSIQDLTHMLHGSLRSQPSSQVR